MILIFLFFFISIFSLFPEKVNGNFLFPIPEEFTIHRGEDFCDEMYLHSYRSRRYHTAEDYILKWNSEKQKQGEEEEEKLIELHKQHFQYVPENASFWKDSSSRIAFLKINLYRVGIHIIDTELGLYPRTKDDHSYGYGKQAFAVYNGKIIDEVSPEKPKGWGKAILIEHKAPKGFHFEIFWKGRNRKLNTFWTQYSHNLKNISKKGNLVRKGEPVALIGDGNGIFNTSTGVDGIREGAHLHFEIRIKKYPLFPDQSLVSDKEKLEEIYIKPSYFLENAKLIKN